MRNLRLLLLPVVLVGCRQQSSVVFVDLDLVPISKQKPSPTAKPQSRVIESSSPNSRTIPGESEKTVENLKADKKAAIRAEVDKETNDAIETISKRLQTYYSREIDDFYKAQFAKLVPYKQSLARDHFADIRAVFESSAMKRGPLLTRLTFLTEFPPPEKDLIPFDTENTNVSKKKREEEIRSLQNSIIQIDLEYESAIRALESKNSSKIDQEAERILAVIAAKQTEIDQRASAEASRLVKRFSSSLSQRIFSRYTLKEIPTKTVKFPQMDVQSDVPRVTFDWNQLIGNERAELNKELEAFLSLNKYERAVSANGAKDVTKEFIEWRTNLKSGHWENWQRSSAQK
jgi:hypothetical protein